MRNECLSGILSGCDRVSSEVFNTALPVLLLESEALEVGNTASEIVLSSFCFFAGECDCCSLTFLLSGEAARGASFGLCLETGPVSNWLGSSAAETCCCLETEVTPLLLSPLLSEIFCAPAAEGNKHQEKS